MDHEQLKKAIYSFYNIRPDHLTDLAGYDSKNILVESDGQHYLLKIYSNEAETISQIVAENSILNQLESLPVKTPLPFLNIEHEELTHLKDKGVVLRMLSYLKGQLLGDVAFSTLRISSLGRSLALLDKGLFLCRNGTIAARETTWDLEHFAKLVPNLRYISNPSDRKIVAYFLQHWQIFVVDKISDFRKSIIHNDTNEWNVLVENDEIAGIIDFGDMVRSRLIFETAIASAYIGMHVENPIEKISILLKAYHSELPLYEKELDIFYYCIAAKLCTSVLHSAKAKKDFPDRPYITISERLAWALLHQWMTINPLYALKVWRKALGFESVQIQKNLKVRRNQCIPKALSLSYDRPIHMVKAAFQYMYDAEGNTLLDAYNNIIQVGHCHPAVVAAGQKSMATLNTNTRYLYDILPQYAEHLLNYFPDHLNQILFVNSGSAASDLAIRLARVHSGNEKVVVMEHGYHGNTALGINLSHYKFAGLGGTRSASQVLSTPLPDTYRGIERGPLAGIKYAQHLENQLTKLEIERLAAFIAEPIVGCGGQVPLAKGYLKEVYQSIRSRNGVCISDEVQVGFGRLGHWFWGFEMHDVLPDIVILGKPMGNGHPIAAVVTTQAIADSFNNGMEFFSSFGGNPVSCSIGNAVLEVIEEEGLQDHAAQVGDYLKNELNRLKQTFPVIGDVRGEGLFLGVDLINSGTEPNQKLATTLVNFLREQNVLTSLDGPGYNVIKIKPPLCFNLKNATELVEKIKKGLNIYTSKTY